MTRCFLLLETKLLKAQRFPQPSDILGWPKITKPLSYYCLQARDDMEEGIPERNWGSCSGAMLKNWSHPSQVHTDQEFLKPLSQTFLVERRNNYSTINPSTVIWSSYLDIERLRRHKSKTHEGPTFSSRTWVGGKEKACIEKAYPHISLQYLSLHIGGSWRHGGREGSLKGLE